MRTGHAHFGNGLLHRSGFTLIELLVVIAIIVLLVSILVPSLKKAKSLARAMLCGTNIRQIGQGFAFYQNEWGGFLPPLNSYRSYNAQGTEKNYGMWNCIGPYLGQEEWGGILSPPTSNPEADPGHLKYDSYWGSLKKSVRSTPWMCPEVDEDDSKAHPWGHGYAESLYLQTPAGLGAANPRSWSVPRPFNEIPNPGTKIHVSDAMDWHLGSVTAVGIPNSNGLYTFDIYRHDGNVEILFAYGHVGSYDGTDVAESIYVDSDSKSIKNFSLN